MNRRMESLLGQPQGVPDPGADSEGTSEQGPPSDEHPDSSWRADALGKSRHARLSDHIQEPREETSAERSREVCAEACRELFLDYAPVVGCLPGEDRDRCQAVATYGRLLFDFARQSGVEGERLAALNRIEFTLEASLSGEPVGQPVFRQLAAAEQLRPLEREALDELAAVARQRITEPRPRTADSLQAWALRLAEAGHRAVIGGSAHDSVLALGAVVVRLRALSVLGEAMRRGVAGMPLSELPAAGDPARPLDRATIDRAVRAEIERLRVLLESAADAPRHLPRRYRSAGRYLLLVSRGLIAEIDKLGWSVVSQPPRLGIGARLGALIRARVGI